VSKPAGDVYRQSPELPSERHRQLLALLRATAHRDRAGRLVTWWPQAKLAARLGISVRTLRNVLADLREPGPDPRHPRGTPPGLRLGLVRVQASRRPVQGSNRTRFGGNLYVLVEVPQQATPESSETAAQVNRQEDPVACLNKEKPVAEGGGEYSFPTVRGVAPDPVEMTVEPPESAMLGHDPSPTEVLATLTAVFGPVQVKRRPERHEPSPPTYRTARGRVAPRSSALAGGRGAVCCARSAGPPRGRSAVEVAPSSLVSGVSPMPLTGEVEHP
jgi:hypothetical protein